MLGLLVNLGVIIIGSAIGVVAKKKISERIANGILMAIGLCVLYIGITGLFTGANSIVILISFAAGTLIGEGLDLDGKLDRAGQKLADKIRKKGNSKVDSSTSAESSDPKILKPQLTGKTDIHEQVNAGLTFFLISCTGAYTITACFTAGLGDNNMLYVKAILDFVVSMTMAAAVGFGVVLSIFPMLIYQGLLILCGGLLSPLLNESMIAALSCAGAVITMAIGLNMIGATKLKPVNYLPAIIFAPVLQYIADLLL